MCPHRFQGPVHAHLQRGHGFTADGGRFLETETTQFQKLDGFALAFRQHGDGVAERLTVVASILIGLRRIERKGFRNSFDEYLVVVLPLALARGIGDAPVGNRHQPRHERPPWIVSPPDHVDRHQDFLDDVFDILTAAPAADDDTPQDRDNLDEKRAISVAVTILGAPHEVGPTGIDRPTALV